MTVLPSCAQFRHRPRTLISANSLNNKQPEQLSINVPELPAVIRYYDDFTDNLCSIQRPCEADIWPLSVSGSIKPIDFKDFSTEIRPLIKHWCGALLQTHAVATVHIKFYGLRSVRDDDLRILVTSTPHSIRQVWQLLMSRAYGATAMTSLKSVLHHYCQFGIGDWSPQYSDFLSTLSLPAVDKYATVRRGDVFLSVDEEAVLVAHFDQISHKVVQTPGLISDNALRATAILICSFQFGLRPKQIGMLQFRDVRIWPEAGADYPSVHLTFKMVKQRSATKALPLPRKIKREWGPIFIELHTRAVQSEMAATDHFFGVSSARETGVMITRLTGTLLPEPRCATELRHTAAQRLVDAGANQEELAEYLGHSDIESGLVYFQTSANQAERVNKAMGISAIYQQVLAATGVLKTFAVRCLETQESSLYSR